MKDFPKVTIILRGYDYEQVRTVVKVLAESSIRSVEITMNSPDAFEIISKISNEFGDRVMVGAGTVMTLEEAVGAVEAGAQFILAPVMLKKEILEYCRLKGVITVPGAFSPTEIHQSFQDGADIVKVFPAHVLGSKYLKDIAAPLGKMELMVVGGINSDNILEYFEAGATCAGIASGVFEKDDIKNRNEEGLRRSIAYLENKLGRLQ